ncbi:hypothetical protein LTR37_018509 [Vermiconidia calcicola]|uniref:Uncharacterized protein n=1 Tax=Vermiconidia calcicola TaxID=1690605 RepID=A0ACC3MIH0_9PEZI|nr:hypothetical protein LTR37_018509 [Vermiconidia calcicola]
MQGGSADAHCHVYTTAVPNTVDPQATVTDSDEELALGNSYPESILRPIDIQDTQPGGTHDTQPQSTQEPQPDGISVEPPEQTEEKYLMPLFPKYSLPGDKKKKPPPSATSEVSIHPKARRTTSQKCDAVGWILMTPITPTDNSAGKYGVDYLSEGTHDDIPYCKVGKTFFYPPDTTDKDLIYGAISDAVRDWCGRSSRSVVGSTRKFWTAGANRNSMNSLKGSSWRRSAIIGSAGGANVALEAVNTAKSSTQAKPSFRAL